jgi:hypothetical protein
LEPSQNHTRRKEREKKKPAGAKKKKPVAKRTAPVRGGKKAPPAKKKRSVRKKTESDDDEDTDDEDNEETPDTSADVLLAQSLAGKRVSARNLDKKGKQFKKQAALARIREVCFSFYRGFYHTQHMPYISKL